MDKITGMLLKEVLAPAFRRLGTVFGTYLVTAGVQEELATQIAVGAAALLAVVSDLLLSHKARKAR